MANVAQISEHATWTRAGPVVSRMTEGDIMALEERATATIADPIPLGLFGFATGTWISGAIVGGAFAPEALGAIAPILLFFAGIAQFVAGLFAFRRVNALAATAFGSFGAFNTASGLLFLLQSAHLMPATGDPVVLQGFFVESFGFIAFALFLASLRTNAAIVITLLLVTIGEACAGIPDLANSVGRGAYGLVGNIGGWFLVASSVCAYYAGTAFLVNSTWKRTVLPVGGQP